jgi:hypothetical protein
VLLDKPRHVVDPAAVARRADDGERRGSNVG